MLRPPPTPPPCPASRWRRRRDHCPRHAAPTQAPTLTAQPRSPAGAPAQRPIAWPPRLDDVHDGAGREVRGQLVDKALDDEGLGLLNDLLILIAGGGWRVGRALASGCDRAGGAGVGGGGGMGQRSAAVAQWLNGEGERTGPPQQRWLWQQCRRAPAPQSSECSMHCSDELASSSMPPTGPSPAPVCHGHKVNGWHAIAIMGTVKGAAGLLSAKGCRGRRQRRAR
jgi:hypothetical protein